MSGLIRAVVDAAIDEARWVRWRGAPLLTPLFVSLAIALGTPRLADAHAIWIERVRVESPTCEGTSFGDVGQYEKLVGRAYSEIDPRDPLNVVVADLDPAERNTGGMVEYVTDIDILRPIDRAKVNHRLFVEIKYRGINFSFRLLNDATTGGDDPTTAADAGHGFLRRQGCSIALSRWDATAPPGAGRSTLTVPIATRSDRSPLEHRYLRTAVEISGFQQRLASRFAHQLQQRTADIGGLLPPPQLTKPRAGPSPEVTASPNVPHVRDNGDPAIAVLLREAQERSATFRRLVETIDATDGIVYVEQGKRCGAGVRACLLLSVTVAGPSRILRVYVNVDRDPPEVMASIGHELQHAVEVLREPGVTTGVLMFQFFDRMVGSLSARNGLSFETEVALNAGDAVRAEIERSRQGSPAILASPSGNGTMGTER